jgi:Domain of unknown function (DUF3854)
MIAPDSTPRLSPFAPQDKTLSEEHERELMDSSISPEVKAGRGWWTAQRRDELPGCFKEYQRRAPALVAPFYSPNGETISAQIKPKNPRLDKKAKPIKYETPGGKGNLVLDVHPFMHSPLRNRAIQLWITEGAKKGDSLTSRGKCTISLSGVWNWMADGEPLACWEHVPLTGRLVYVAFDSDWRTNENVHCALARLVAFLEDRGAQVLVVDVPHIGEGKSGVDDYMAAGGELEELEQGAKPYEPADVATERLSRDEKLRVATSSLWDRWRARERRTKGDYTDRSIERVLIRESERRGTLVKDGVRIVMGKRALALEAGVSTRVPTRSITRLEQSGYLRRDNKERKAEAPGAFVLLTDAVGGARYCPHNGGEKGTPEEKGKSEGKEGISLVKAACDPGGDTSARPTGEVPELRWPTIRFRQEKDKRGRSVMVGEYVARLGKKRAAVVEYLVERNGVATIGELMEQFASPKARPRDFRRRTLAMLEESPAVVLVEGDVVSLVHSWREALEGARFITDEQGDRERQAAKHASQWEAFRRRDEHPADPEPEMPQTPDVRESWALHPEGCACPECSERFGRVIGECVDNCRCARCYTARKGAERDKPALALLLPPRRATAPLREAPATVVPIRPEPEDWRSHPLGCECSDCLCSEPTYARPYSGASV